jgi:Tfp pilus assembly protein FimV
LESLWFCGTSADVASDPRCFPARALGELREYQATKTQTQRAALAKKTLEHSGNSWKDLKKSLGRFTESFDMPLPAAAAAAAPRRRPEAAPLPLEDLTKGNALLRSAIDYRVTDLQTQINALRHELRQRAPVTAAAAAAAPVPATVRARATTPVPPVARSLSTEATDGIPSPTGSLETLPGTPKPAEPPLGLRRLPTSFASSTGFRGITGRVPGAS